MTEKFEIIRSSQNKYVSLVRSLEDKKGREKNSLFRFDGVKLACEAVRKGVKLSFILLDEGALEAVLDKAEKLYGVGLLNIGCKVVVVESSLFARLSDEMAPEGIISVAEYMADRCSTCLGEELRVSEKENIVLLESVRDPSNVGAIIRAAAAFGADRIVMSHDCADVYNSKTIRASMGTVFSVKITRVDDIKSAIATLRSGSRRVFAAALDRDAKKLGEIEIKDGDCILIGNEGHGLSKEAIDASDSSVFIPMREGVESLNAATAAAVLMWEFFGSR